MGDNDDNYDDFDLEAWLAAVPESERVHLPPGFQRVRPWKGRTVIYVDPALIKRYLKDD